eukprot:1179407-Prorocentrum_minimum.AAC.2
MIRLTGCYFDFLDIARPPPRDPPPGDRLPGGEIASLRSDGPEIRDPAGRRSEAGQLQGSEGNEGTNEIVSRVEYSHRILISQSIIPSRRRYISICHHLAITAFGYYL